MSRAGFGLFSEDCRWAPAQPASASKIGVLARCLGRSGLWHD